MLGILVASESKRCTINVLIFFYPHAFLSRVKNIMFEQEKYPEEMQLSKFICLHKKGETTNITNYRTIATGCNLCKLYLKLICNRITNIAEQNLEQVTEEEKI